MDQSKAEQYVCWYTEIRKSVNESNTSDWVGNRFIDIVNKYGYLSSTDMEKTVMNYFSNIFSDLFSNSVLLVKDDGNRYEREYITAGRYGFGIRENKQAKPVSNYSQVLILNKHKDKIITALNNRRKWNKAEELVKFFNLTEKIKFDSYNQKTIGLGKDIKTFDGHGKLCNMSFIRIVIPNNDEVRIALNNDDSHEYIYINEFAGDDRTFSSVLSNYLLSSQMPDILKSFEDFIKEKSEEQKMILSELDKEFGRFIMCNKL